MRSSAPGKTAKMSRSVEVLDLNPTKDQHCSTSSTAIEMVPRGKTTLHSSATIMCSVMQSFLYAIIPDDDDDDEGSDPNSPSPHLGYSQPLEKEIEQHTLVST